MTLPEFIGPLSLCSNTMDDKYEEFREFTKNFTGFKPPAEEGGDGGDKAPKKKKGKKGKWRMIHCQSLFGSLSIKAIKNFPKDLRHLICINLERKI